MVSLVTNHYEAQMRQFEANFVMQTYLCSASYGFLWVPTSRQADSMSVHDDIHQRATVYNDKITTGRWVDGAMGVHCIWGSKLWQIYRSSGQWRGQSVPECANDVINKLIWGHGSNCDILLQRSHSVISIFFNHLFIITACEAHFKNKSQCRNSCQTHHH